jgi:hypothetical protein
VVVTRVSSIFNMPNGTNIKFKLKKKDRKIEKIVQKYIHSAVIKKVKCQETFKNEGLNI